MSNSSIKRSNAALINKFLRSESSSFYNLNSTMRQLLRVIASYLDMGSNKCCPKQSIVAFECGVSEKTCRENLKKLAKYKLIEMNKKWKLYHYKLTNIVLNLSPVTISDDKAKPIADPPPFTGDHRKQLPVTIDIKKKNKDIYIKSELAPAKASIFADEISVEQFINLYPIKCPSKHANIKSEWKKLNEEDKKQIMNDLPNRIKNHCRWKDKKYIQNPVNYLHKKIFLDEIIYDLGSFTSRYEDATSVLAKLNSGHKAQPSPLLLNYLKEHSQEQ